VAVLRVSPALEPFEVGLFTLEKKLRSPLIAAFWEPALLARSSARWHPAVSRGTPVTRVP
jgi:hypothetical protein